MNANIPRSMIFFALLYYLKNRPFSGIRMVSNVKCWLKLDKCFSGMISGIFSVIYMKPSFNDELLSLKWCWLQMVVIKFRIYIWIFTARILSFTRYLKYWKSWKLDFLGYKLQWWWKIDDVFYYCNYDPNF